MATRQGIDGGAGIFPPEVVTLGSNTFVFVDGEVTPYNLPAFLMFRLVTALPYKLEWPTGESKLMIVSVGTGSALRLGPTGLNPDRTFVGIAQSIAGEMMDGMAYDQDVNCRTIGRCSFGSEVDRELGTLVPDMPLATDLGRQFLYARYDPLLTREGLDDIGLKEVQTERVATLTIPLTLSMSFSRSGEPTPRNTWTALQALWSVPSLPSEASDGIEASRLRCGCGTVVDCSRGSPLLAVVLVPSESESQLGPQLSCLQSAQRSYRSVHRRPGSRKSPEAI